MRGDAMPLFAIAWWYEQVILGQPLNGAAHANEHAYLFFDELRNVSDWAPQLKALVDHYAVRVVVTGSSAFRIAAGRDSLAGRVATVEMGPLLLREIAGLRWGGRSQDRPGVPARAAVDAVRVQTDCHQSARCTVVSLPGVESRTPSRCRL